MDAQALIVGGKKVKKGDYPWQAAIYDKTRNNMNICGGTIISMKTVVSGICLSQTKSRFFIFLLKTTFLFCSCSLLCKKH